MAITRVPWITLPPPTAISWSAALSVRDKAFKDYREREKKDKRCGYPVTAEPRSVEGHTADQKQQS
jgi:hypothetical protein